MFARILVPMDQTARADEALQAASHLARRCGAALSLLYAAEPTTEPARVEAAERALACRAEELRAQGLEATFAVRFERPGEAIAEAASAQGADLVVMAPHLRAGWVEALAHPSVTARTFAHSAVPVLVWPGKAPGRALDAFLNVPGAAVIAALDGGELAERALPFAVAFARAYAGRLVVVRAVMPVHLGVAGPEIHRLEREEQGEQELEVRRYLAAVRRRLGDEGIADVESMVLHGVPERELLRLAETHEGSLLVLGTHGRTGLARALMGSVAVELMRQSPVPLLVVPPGAAAPTKVRRDGRALPSRP